MLTNDAPTGGFRGDGTFTDPMTDPLSDPVTNPMYDPADPNIPPEDLPPAPDTGTDPTIPPDPDPVDIIDDPISNPDLGDPDDPLRQPPPPL